MCQESRSKVFQKSEPILASNHCRQWRSISVRANYMWLHYDDSPNTLGALADFFFATSALVELPTFAAPFLGFDKPAGFVDPRGFGPSAFEGFNKLATFTPFIVFSGCSGRRGQGPALSTIVSIASWTCNTTSSYAGCANVTSMDIPNSQAQYATQDHFLRTKTRNIWALHKKLQRSLVFVFCRMLFK